jgi:hypothetical protein
MGEEAEKLKSLTEKLKTKGDISLEEADWIFSLLSAIKFDPHSSRYDRDLSAALSEWYTAVGKKIKEYGSGNFIFTIAIGEAGTRWIDIIITPARAALKEYGSFEDLCSTIIMNKKAWLSFPFKHLFTKIKHEDSKDNFYEMKSTRAGIYRYPFKTESGTHSIAQLMKRYSPLIDELPMNISRIPLGFFEMAGESKEVAWNSAYYLKKEIKLYVLAEFMKRNNISCSFIAAVDDYNDRSTFFVEREKVPILRAVMDIPLEKLVKNALSRNIIDKEMAANILSDSHFLHWGIPVMKLAKASAEHVDDIIKLKMEWEAKKKEIENENEWINYTR